MYYSDNPIDDFNRWDMMMERQRESCCRGKCTHCGEDVYDYEEHYDIDGDLFHDECLIDWAQQYRRGA